MKIIILYLMLLTSAGCYSSGTMEAPPPLIRITSTPQPARPVISWPKMSEKDLLKGLLSGSCFILRFKSSVKEEELILSKILDDDRIILRINEGFKTASFLNSKKQKEAIFGFDTDKAALLLISSKDKDRGLLIMPSLMEIDNLSDLRDSVLKGLNAPFFNDCKELKDN